MTRARTVNLAALLQGIDFRASGDPRGLQISGITADSRLVGPGVLFVALTGHRVDGHDFISQAVSNGCAAIMIERGRAPLPDEPSSSGTTIIEVANSRQALGQIAAAFYDHPARDLQMIGITGTNGKTTCSYLVESILRAAGRPCGVIGTVNYRYSNDRGETVSLDAPYTTPEPVSLQELLDRMRNSGTDQVIMEVSSHALAQDRIAGLLFDVAAFTNLSRDHLDFHVDMDGYFHSKKKLFLEHLKPDGTVVISLQASTPALDTGPRSSGKAKCWGHRLADALGPVRTITCGMEPEYDVHPTSYSLDFDGIRAEIVTPIGLIAVRSPLIGLHNLRNILTAASIGLAATQNLKKEERLAAISAGIDNLDAIPGRLERIVVAEENKGQQCQVFVDYAHTPDALENVLSTLRRLGPARLICVFGCGGDRDVGKRPFMGEVAGRLADVVLATSDNPRSESPQQILVDIENGLRRTGLSRGSAAEMLGQSTGKGYDIIIDRRQAIDTAIRFANRDDVVLIAGKGHEDYQICGQVRNFFDDRLEAKRSLEATT